MPIALSGDDRYVADYLYAEALEHQSEERQAVPATHGGPRSAERAALRRSPRRGERRMRRCVASKRPARSSFRSTGGDGGSATTPCSASSSSVSSAGPNPS